MPDLELLRALAPPVAPADPVTVARVRRRALRHRRRRPVLLAAPVAVCAVLLALLQVGGERTFAEAALHAAESSPRLLVEGWEVTRVDEWDAATGEMTFERDGHTLELSWSSQAPTKKAGTSIWREGNVWVRARGSGPEFLAALDAIEKVSAEDWLRALPESAVAPRDQAATVDEMLKALPLPPKTRDRYQLGARVPPTDERRGRLSRGRVAVRRRRGEWRRQRESPRDTRNRPRRTGLLTHAPRALCHAAGW